MSLEKICQKKWVLLDALRDFRRWFEMMDEHEDRLMRDEIDDAIMTVKEL